MKKKVGEFWPMPSATMYHLLVYGNIKQGGKKAHIGKNVKWVIAEDDEIN
jgi:hypothetical protein